MDPYVVEFLRGDLSREIDLEIKYEIERREYGIKSKLREGDIDDARYFMGQVDGLMLAISILNKIRKE